MTILNGDESEYLILVVLGGWIKSEFHTVEPRERGNIPAADRVLKDFNGQQ